MTNAVYTNPFSRVNVGDVSHPQAVGAKGRYILDKQTFCSKIRTFGFSGRHGVRRLCILLDRSATRISLAVSSRPTVLPSQHWCVQHCPHIVNAVIVGVYLPNMFHGGSITKSAGT